jgi:hypothetical protein
MMRKYAAKSSERVVMAVLEEVMGSDPWTTWEEAAVPDVVIIARVTADVDGDDFSDCSRQFPQADNGPLKRAFP